MFFICKSVSFSLTCNSRARGAFGAGPRPRGNVGVPLALAFEAPMARTWRMRHEGALALLFNFTFSLARKSLLTATSCLFLNLRRLSACEKAHVCGVKQA